MVVYFSGRSNIDELYDRHRLAANYWLLQIQLAINASRVISSFLVLVFLFFFPD